jgi:hypothetical protein
MSAGTPSQEDRSDIAYELLISKAGTCVLTCGGEVMWSSDGDDKFLEDMDEVVSFEDDEQIDDVLDWLVDNDYVPPDVDVAVLPEEEAGL